MLPDGGSIVWGEHVKCLQLTGLGACKSRLSGVGLSFLNHPLLLPHPSFW